MSRHNQSISRGPLIAVLLIIVQGSCLAALKAGDSLPDLTSFKLEGKLPDQLKGQVILLDFWASWCAPCKSSFPAMQELHAKYKDKGLTIVAVSVDEKPENMKAFLDAVKVTFCVVRDSGQKLVAAADVPTMPTSILIDRTGKIRIIHAGFDANETTKQYVKEIEQLLGEPKP